jgi:hypothetical protein
MKRAHFQGHIGIVIAGMCACLPAAAGTIWGTIRENGVPLVNAQLVLSCPSGNAAPVTTDSTGSYRFTIGGEGTCQLQIQSGGRQTSTQVIVYSDPARYDFRFDGGRLVRQ